MDITTKGEKFKNIFQNSLKIEANSISIKTLLSERNLSRINYTPYYQRNYVWDPIKQTFFIESVILGTEVPPLILFKSGNKIEVIDGRQRFETLKRFKENDFSLKNDGLKELTALKGQNFNRLSDENKQIFLNSNIRVIEFEVVNYPNLDEDAIDRVKKEIFRRYNTGITPLTKDELDNAKYDEDIFSDLFKKTLRNNEAFFKKFNLCFFPKEFEKPDYNKESLITKNLDFIRRSWILNLLPIKKYAGGTGRIEMINLFYDFAKNNSQDIQYDYERHYNVLNQVILLFDVFKKNGSHFNRFAYECMLWALRIINEEGKEVNINDKSVQNLLLKHYIDNFAIYDNENSYHYSSIVNRFKDTASVFTKIIDLEFDNYIRNENFKKISDELKQTDSDVEKTIQDLNNLRLNKPQSISTPVDELRHEFKTFRNILRPSYQRQEKINDFKASSIIESILLGIKLPPIFLFNKINKIREVVDGQQRLLSILAFLGEQYSDEDGKLTYSLNNNFKLKGLNVLPNLNNLRYSELEEYQQDKILDFALDIINIDQNFNPNFDPIDLFIRLNYKPYPIKSNSFEMWNSIVNKDVIQTIKDITKKYSDGWFYLRDIDGKPDRMENEELITILSYINYVGENYNNIIGFFKRRDRITCRLKDKKALNNFLTNEIENKVLEKERFIESIYKTERFILLLAPYFDKESFSEFLNVKENKTFRRSLQDFYIIWIILSQLDENVIKDNLSSILVKTKDILKELKNTNSENIDDQYFISFINNLGETIKFYKQ